MINIDLQDPRIARMLAPSTDLAAGPREVVQLAGDAPDPTGMSAQRGLMSMTRLCAGRHEVGVVYQGMLLTADVYVLAGEPVKIHILCPRCRKPSQITGDRKHIDYDPLAPNPMLGEIMAIAARVHAPTDRLCIAAMAATGRLSVAPYVCAWEVGGDAYVAGRVHTGASLCRARIAIDNNRARDA